jgi:hypothetical protein
MNVKHFQTFAVLVTIQQYCVILVSSVPFGSECLIHSQKFAHQYLYTKESSQTYLYRLDNVDDFERLVWNITSFQVVDGKTYHLIKHKKSGQYLCRSAKSRQTWLQKLLKISRAELENLSQPTDYCYWRFEKINNFLNENIYTIWSRDPYREQLFATSFSRFFENALSHKKLLLSPKRNEKIKWHIDCHHGDFLWS